MCDRRINIDWIARFVFIRIGVFIGSTCNFSSETIDEENRSISIAFTVSWIHFAALNLWVGVFVCNWNHIFGKSFSGHSSTEPAAEFVKNMQLKIKWIHCNSSTHVIATPDHFAFILFSLFRHTHTRTRHTGKGRNSTLSQQCCIIPIMNWVIRIYFSFACVFSHESFVNGNEQLLRERAPMETPSFDHRHFIQLVFVRRVNWPASRRADCQSGT